MAEEKKVTAKKAAPKKTTEKKEAAKKTAVKKEVVKKEAEKKEPVKKASAKKAAVKETVIFQFSGKSYTSSELINICKDVWKYDLNGKEENLKSVELYVKPDESMVYYVINEDITGNFLI